jgi:hypothetical protein
VRIAFFGDAKYVGAHEWMRFLSEQEGFEVHAIVFPGHEREIPRVTFHTLRGLLPRGKTRYFLCVPALRKSLREIAPDLFIAYRIVSYGLSAALTGFHPLVLAAQGMYIASRATPRFSRAFARRALRSADLLHAWAPIMTDNMTTRQLERYYNFPTLIEAISKVRKELGEVRYLIAGEGSARGELEALVREKGLETSVRFLGAVAKDRLPGLLGESHLYVAAVPSDGTSSSMLEAMAAGVVPIVADNESNRFWVTDRLGGRLVPAFDASAYAEAILEAWRSEGWRGQAREMNRKIVESRASWWKNMAVFVQAYRDLSQGRSPLARGGRAREPA